MAGVPSDRSLNSRGLDATMTLEQFIIDRRADFPHSTTAFSRLLRDVSVAGKIINHNIRRAGILDVVGDTETINVQGERQKKLDRIADREFVKALRRGGECCLIGSEEQPETIPIGSRAQAQEDFAIFFDPLDGSSNTNVNASVGTIFSVYTLPEKRSNRDLLDLALRPGVEQVAAGYIAYGSSTMFVFTTGKGVNGFTLDPGLGEFLLTHPDLQIPDQPAMYSVNEADIEDFSPELRSYLRWLKQKDPGTNSRIRARYIGSFVSDFHRNLLTGGIYVYPATASHPEGKLRLMYEANPMAFLMEQAGGRASTGHQRILEVEPMSLHQRTPLYIGSPTLVKTADAFLQNREHEVLHGDA